jgi:hypothetical protein
MLHSQIWCQEEVYSWLLVVGSQIANLIPDPSFAHNLGCRCPMTNASHFQYLHFKTFSMTPRTPQCKVFWALLSNLEHSGVPEDSKSPTLQVLGFTPTLGQSGVATLSHTRRKRSMSSLTLRIFPHTIAIAFFWILGHLPTFAIRTLSQANLGVPKIPTLSWQVQEGLVENPLLRLRQKRTKLA